MNNFRELSKLLSRVENREKGFFNELATLFPKKRGIPVWGFTGPPGSGKSTLVDQVIANLRKKNLKIAVLAVDPSSSFTGGSLLGDRIRMQRHFEDKGVFIRSLGHRGTSGGLSLATRDLIVCLDAYGFDHILIETVGVGQTELGIITVADTTVVLLVPEGGDAIQMLKAGLTEIADIFVVNKADREGAGSLQKMVQATLTYRVSKEEIKHHQGISKSQNLEIAKSQNLRKWEMPVLLTQAETGEGTEELLLALEQHTAFLRTDSESKKRRVTIRRRHFLDLYWEVKRIEFEQQMVKDKKFQKELDAIAEGTKNPYEVLMKTPP